MKQWLRLLSKGYFVQVPTPLPAGAPTQNLILWLISSVPSHTEGRVRSTQPKSLRQLCRAIGLNHGSRNVVLRQAIREAARWFADHGGELGELKEDEDGIVFPITEPRIPRIPRPTLDREPPTKEPEEPVRERATSPPPTARNTRPVGPALRRQEATDENGRRDYIWTTLDGRVVSDDEAAEYLRTLNRARASHARS